MKAMKVLAAAAVALLGTSAFAEFKASGLLRSGVQSIILDDGTDADPAGIISTASADFNLAGYNLGLGADRFRVALDWEEEKAGASVQYTNDEDISAWDLTADNIDHAFAYAKLFDNFLTVSAGKLNGGNTGTDGDAGWDFGGLYGARLAISPVEGLTVEVNAAKNDCAVYAPGMSHATLDALSAAVKYSNDAFAVAAGYKLCGNAYAGFSLSAVENLSLALEAEWKSDEVSGCANDNGEAVASTVLCATVSYDLDPVRFGAVAYFDVTEDNDSINLYPFVEVGLNDVLEGFSVGLDVAYEKAGSADDAFIKFTPEATFAAGENASVQAYYSYGFQGDVTLQAIGLGVIYNF